MEAFSLAWANVHDFNSVVFQRETWHEPKVYVWEFDYKRDRNKRFGIREKDFEKIAKSIAIDMSQVKDLAVDEGSFVGDKRMVDSLVLTTMAIADSIIQRNQGRR